MSISFFTALEFSELLIIYSVLTVVIPYLVFRRWLSGWNLSLKFCASFIIGNFYVIFLVILLTALSIPKPFLLILFTILPAIFAGIKINQVNTSQIFKRQRTLWSSFFLHEIGFKLFFINLFRPLCIRIIHLLKKVLSKFISRPLEWIFCFVCLGCISYSYGLNLLSDYGYMSYDAVVHLDWINSMEQGILYVDGVYPFGMHCIVYYLHAITGAYLFSIMRIFGLIETLFIYATIVSFAKYVCKTRFAPYLGLLCLTIFSVVRNGYLARFYNALPQEFGMMFILPCAIFLMDFISSREVALDAIVGASSDVFLAPKEKHFNLCVAFNSLVQTSFRSVFSLILFGLSVALTLQAHPYDTYIAGLLCISVAIAWCRSIFKHGNVFCICISGIMGLLLGAFPMIVAFVFGKNLQASFLWGSGEINLHTSFPKSIRAFIYSSLSGLDNFFVSSNYARIYFWAVLVFSLIAIAFLVHRKTYFRMAPAVTGITFIVILTLSYIARNIGLPQLLPPARIGNYLAAYIPLFFAVSIDILCSFFNYGKHRVWIDILGCVAYAAALILSISSGMLEQLQVRETPKETNGAVISLYSIMESYPSEKWTIVSAGDELQMMGEQGWHTEIITFLTDMEFLSAETVVTIPTQYVFFFVEKYPLIYCSYDTGFERQYVSEEAASHGIPFTAGIWQYSEDRRLNLMSRMYYWAQAFDELYPKEFQVFYEDDEFVCYFIEQNEYDLYNFAIDYGFNNISE